MQMRKSFLPVSFLALLVAMVAPIQSVAQGTPKEPDAFTKDVVPFVKTNCIGCHSGPNPADNFAIPDLTKAPTAKEARIWRKMAKQVDKKSMPPKGSPQPTDVDRKKLVDWVNKTFPKKPN